MRVRNRSSVRVPRGFTLIELLTVITIIGVIAALSLVAIAGSRAAAAQTGCSDKLRQIGMGLHAHQATHGIFPPQQPAPSNSPGSSYSYEGISWHVYILPFIEQNSLWNAAQMAFQQNVDPRSAPHTAVAQVVVSSYVCPSDQRLNSTQLDPDRVAAGFTSYVGMVGGDSVFGRRQGIGPEAITDGLSQTLMVGERPPPDSFRLGWWYTTHDFTGPASVNDQEVPPDHGINAYDGGPLCAGSPVSWPGFGGQSFAHFAPGSTQNDCDRLHYWSLHSGGANFLFADGSVRFLTYAVAPHLRALATISSGETP